MKSLVYPFLLVAALSTGLAGGIDRVLTPLPSDLEIAKHEGMLVASLQVTAEAAPVVAMRKGTAPQRFLKSQEVLTLLGKQISDYYSLKGTFKLDFARPWQPLKLPGDSYEIVITDYPGNGVGSSFLLGCKVVSEGETVSEFQLSLRAQLWQEVWGALSKLDRGLALDSTKVAIQKVDVLREKQSYLPSNADPAVYDMAQGVAAGRPLTMRDVIERPLVHKGQVVEVIARQGTFNIRMKALALEDGAGSAIIKMRNLDSRKDFNAQIINENQVAVHF